MAQQETYGNWLGPKRLLRQPAIYSVPGKMSPVGNFRPASPDSFEDDYDDVSVVGSDQAPPAKDVYLLAGPPGSSRAPSPKDPEDFSPSSRHSDPKSRDLAPKSGNSALVAVLALLVALSALAWGGLLAVAIGKHKEMSAELELLKSNLSGIWDSAGADPAAVRDPPAPAGAAGTHRAAVPGQELPAVPGRMEIPWEQLLLLFPGFPELGQRPQRLRRPRSAPGGRQLRGGAGVPAGEQQPQQLLLAGGDGRGAGGEVALGHRGGSRFQVLGCVAGGLGEGAEGLRHHRPPGALGQRALLGIPPLDL
ncbi:uncharacterized protein LOC107198825 isoform X2 [Parus major]|uniref:uncharacterized protein LOC107198825 isoform X2 n=1 Tax=Parus major TaxID=9157 RepID=UPI0014445123|nr:uncharacterized protein LOC107198825 isoform X2 [Parus major]